MRLILLNFSLFHCEESVRTRARAAYECVAMFRPLFSLRPPPPPTPPFLSLVSSHLQQESAFSRRKNILFEGYSYEVQYNTHGILLYVLYSRAYDTGRKRIMRKGEGTSTVELLYLFQESRELKKRTNSTTGSNAAVRPTL